MTIVDEIEEGRTDLVVEHLAAGGDATPSLLQSCAYFGDVTALRLLLAKGAQLLWLGDDLGLIGACFHGHWRLCLLLIERGADVNHVMTDTGETPLHSALCTANRLRHKLILQVLLQYGADPNIATKPGVETGGFMRDSRTKGETPLHRAAAFAGEKEIDLLIKAGAKLDARDMNGDSPLGWASWYLRPAPILRKLLFGDFRISPNYGEGMEANVTGKPLL